MPLLPILFFLNTHRIITVYGCYSLCILLLINNDDVQTNGGITNL